MEDGLLAIAGVALLVVGWFMGSRTDRGPSIEELSARLRADAAERADDLPGASRQGSTPMRPSAEMT